MPATTTSLPLLGSSSTIKPGFLRLLERSLRKSTLNLGGCGGGGREAVRDWGREAVIAFWAWNLLLGTARTGVGVSGGVVGEVVGGETGGECSKGGENELVLLLGAEEDRQEGARNELAAELLREGAELSWGVASCPCTGPGDDAAECVRPYPGVWEEGGWGCKWGIFTDSRLGPSLAADSFSFLWLLSFALSSLSSLSLSSRFHQECLLFLSRFFSLALLPDFSPLSFFESFTGFFKFDL